MNNFRAVVFDIDGTLSPEISWTSLTRDLGASVDDHIQIYKAYREGNSNYEQSKAELLDLWRRSGNANKDFFEKLFNDWLLPEASINAVKQVQEAVSVCLITGSMDLYAQTVSRKLGIADYFANTILKWDDTGALVGMDYELDQAAKKLEQFFGFCLRHNFKPKDVAVVGDSDNDIELFKASGNGVAIGTDIPHDLSAVAWRTISKIEDLPAVLDLNSYRH